MSYNIKNLWTKLTLWKRLVLKISGLFINKLQNIIYSYYFSSWFYHLWDTFSKIRMNDYFLGLVDALIAVTSFQVHLAQYQSHLVRVVKVGDAVGCCQHKPVAHHSSPTVVLPSPRPWSPCLYLYLFTEIMKWKRLYKGEEGTSKSLFTLNL